MARDTGKQRSSQIQLDYYRQPDRRRRRIVLAALGVSSLYALWVIAASPSHVNTGPIAEVHSTIESNCALCHQRGLSSNDSPQESPGLFSWLRSFDSKGLIASTEAACRQCHPRVGGHHGESLTPSAALLENDCAACHQEHRGREHDLRRVADQRCVVCHKHLAAVCAQPLPVSRDSISDFGKNHPHFRSLTEDSGTIRFDHRQHMLPGQVESGHRGGMRRTMLSPVAKKRYATTTGPDGLIQLHCNDCHEPDGAPGEPILPSDRELGRYFDRVNYERHCAACHSVNVGIEGDDMLSVPHEIKTPQLRLLLSSGLNGARVSGLARNPRGDRRAVPVPGESFGTDSDTVSAASESDIQRLIVTVAEQCGKCHSADSILDDPDPHPHIPARWLRFAVFDHSAHSEVSCVDCHPGTSAENGRSDAESARPLDSSVVMIANKESCQTCHLPVGAAPADLEPSAMNSSTSSPNAMSKASVSTEHDKARSQAIGSRDERDHAPRMRRTWASDRCTVCHRYHAHLPLRGGVTQ